MKQVGGRSRSLLELTIRNIERRAVRMAVRHIADRHLVRCEIESAANPDVGIPGQQSLLEGNALQILDISQATERGKLACETHDRPDPGARIAPVC
jgi:hypothetical protein